jgi:xylulokinase
MESVAYLARANIELVGDAGIEIKRIILAGGTSYSCLWNQIKADVLGRQVRTIKSKEAGCLGAAILAGLAVGVYPSVQEACAVLIEDDEVYTPCAESHVLYDKYYNAYRKLYESLKPLFEQMASI